jgi:hypothetical protein
MFSLSIASTDVALGGLVWYTRVEGQMMGWVGIWFGTLEHPSMSTEASLAVILLV